MTDAERVVLVAPAAAERVHVAPADAAGEDLHVDVVITLGLELVHALVHFAPCVWGVDLEADGLVPRQGPCRLLFAGARESKGWACSQVDAG